MGSLKVEHFYMNKEKFVILGGLYGSVLLIGLIIFLYVRNASGVSPASDFETMHGTSDQAKESEINSDKEEKNMQEYLFQQKLPI